MLSLKQCSKLTKVRSYRYKCFDILSSLKKTQCKICIHHTCSKVWLKFANLKLLWPFIWEVLFFINSTLPKMKNLTKFKTSSRSLNKMPIFIFLTAFEKSPVVWPSVLAVWCLSYKSFCISCKKSLTSLNFSINHYNAKNVTQYQNTAYCPWLLKAQCSVIDCVYMHSRVSILQSF